MLDELIIALLCLCVYVPLTVQQPPGVPPKQHQQQQVYPNGHGPPGHHQGGPQAGHHQGGPPAGHHSGGHQQGSNFGVNPHDAEHVKEHLKDVVDKPKEQMTEEELEFHYFKLHDYDNNNKLDGVEIVKAITHFHADEEGDSTKEAQMKVFTDQEIANIVDMVLQEDDLNGDGYIEYVEFVTAQRKARHDDK